MKLMVALKLLVAFFCVHLAASAPLRLLRVRNMTFLFVESPDGDRVEILYAPGKGMGSLGSFPIGRVPVETAPKDADLTTKDADLTSVDDNFAPEDDKPASTDDKTTPDDEDEEPFDPELDAPRVEPSVMQAPKFKSPCERGHRADRQGNCRRIW